MARFIDLVLAALGLCSGVLTAHVHERQGEHHGHNRWHQIVSPSSELSSSTTASITTSALQATSSVNGTTSSVQVAIPKAASTGSSVAIVPDAPSSSSASAVPSSLPKVTTVEKTSISTDSTYVTNAHSAITKLQTFYRPNGTWLAGWWNSANCLILLADLRKFDDSSFLTSITDGPDGVFQTTLNKAPPNVTNGFLYDQYYDDEGWWTIALIRTYDITGDISFLTAAEATFKDIASGATSNVPCGGLRWTKPTGPDSVIATLLFVQAAAELATRYPSQESYYLNLALEEWGWITTNILIDNWIQGDGLKDAPACTNDHAKLAYEQGVAIGALIALSNVTGNDTYLTTASAIATSIISDPGHAPAPDHILTEYDTTTDADYAQFKGILMRNLALLQEVKGSSSVLTFLTENANAIWDDDRDASDNTLGLKWSGPYVDLGDTPLGAAAHSSATMALVAAAVVS